MSIDEIASIMTHAELVFGVDTGLTHLAAALKVPVIGLYVGSDPRLTGLHGVGKLINVGGIGRIPAMSEVLKTAEALV
jgi:heptosyltransferase-1